MQKTTAITALVVIVLVVPRMTISPYVLALLASAQTVPSSGTINEAYVTCNNYQDPSSVWSTETNAYDGDTGTAATCAVGAESWSGYLVLNLSSATRGTMINVWLDRQSTNMNGTNLEIANATGSWTLVNSSNPTWAAYFNISWTTSHSYAAMRFSFYNTDASQARTAYVYEARGVRGAVA